MITHPSIIVSGVHSDPDPSPGIGIARSLREGFPGARVIAVDYSVRSSGLHHPDFDEIRVQPVWSELDLATYALQIQRHLEGAKHCWISGLDVEADWLATTQGAHPRLLVPSVGAQRVVRKPDLIAAAKLHMRRPDFLPARSSDVELHALGRHSGWRLWVKGKYHEAYLANSFPHLRHQIKTLENHWPLDDIFVQRHISGHERAFTFAAYDGRLIDAVEVEKRSVTSQGKTWGAAVTSLAGAPLERLASLLEEARWTGGGEVEFVRDINGTDWLIDFNPRFPAYIYGATLCGHNLPASLVGTALSLPVAPGSKPARQFVRVVQEVPVRREIELPQMISNVGATSTVGKHPSFQPALVRRMNGAKARLASSPFGNVPPLPNPLPRWRRDTSAAVRFRDLASVDVLMERLATEIRKCAAYPNILPALSVKTDPLPDLARAFRSRGWWAEVISLKELEWAYRMGFSSTEIVFNGPAAREVAKLDRPSVAIAFADSVESFEVLMNAHSCEIVGLRLRPHFIASRFGVDLANYDVFTRIVSILRQHRGNRKVGIHIHCASDACGPVLWADFLHHAVEWAVALSDASDTVPSVFDIGGGWHADDFEGVFLPELSGIQSRIHERLPNIETILLEPGKAVAARSAWLAGCIIEVRESGSSRAGDVVLNASIADLPMAALYAHRILHYRDGNCLGWLRGGAWRVLGSICMESDILAEGIGFDHEPQVGDELVFSLAGGYNASMAWHFAAGVSRDS